MPPTNELSLSSSMAVSNPRKKSMNVDYQADGAKENNPKNETLKSVTQAKKGEKLSEQVVDVDASHQVADGSTVHSNLDMWLNFELNYINYLETFSASVPVATDPKFPYDPELWDSWINWAAGEPPREYRIFIIDDDSSTVEETEEAVHDKDSGDDNIGPEHSSAQPTPLLNPDVVNVDGNNVQMITESDIWSQYSPGKFDIQWPENYDTTRRAPQSGDERLFEHPQPSGHSSHDNPLLTQDAVIGNTVQRTTSEFNSYSKYSFGTSDAPWPARPMTIRVPDEQAEFVEGSSKDYKLSYHKYQKQANVLRVATPRVHHQPQIGFSNSPATTPGTTAVVRGDTPRAQKTSPQTSVVPDLEQPNSPVSLVSSNRIPSQAPKRKPAGDSDSITASEWTSPRKYRGCVPHKYPQRFPTSTLVTPSHPHRLPPNGRPFTPLPQHKHTPFLPPSTQLSPPPTLPFPTWKTIPLNDHRRAPIFVPCGKVIECAYTGPAVGVNGCRALISSGTQNLNNHLVIHAQTEERMVSAGLLNAENVHAMLWAKKTLFRCSVSGCGYYTEEWQLNGVKERHEMEFHAKR